jgi:hypothetical protein
VTVEVEQELRQRLRTNLYFGFLHCLYHVLVVARKIKETSTLARR